ncbi:MAG TPA: VIT domain-containing protein, partial [Thermoplasmata archaeon]|nr:VIT domain-containing protein [Thermoplasmata archaeon]
MKAARLVFAIGLVVVALLSAPGPAAAFCVIVEPPTPLPTQVNGTQVEIRLTEGFARVVIIKEFYNPSDQPKQGQIAFPLEKGHELITDLRLKIGNVTYGSSTQNRTDALNAFLEAIAKGQDAALVQYDAPRDVYWIAVTIPPKEARTTITTLEMPLTKTDGFYDYGYRLSIDARDSVSYLRVHVHVETTAPLGDV